MSDTGIEKAELSHHENVLLSGVAEKDKARVLISHDPNLNNGEEEHALKVTWRSWIAIACASMSTFTGLLVIAGPAGVITFLIQDLGRPDLIVWLIAAPTVMQASFAPFVARLSDLTGDRKWILTVLAGVGVIGCIVGATAKSMPVLVLGQFIMSITALNVGLTSSIPSEVLPNRLRAHGQATVMYCANAATLVGSVGVGAMVRNGQGWRTVYWVLTACYAACFVGFAVVYNPPRPDVPKITFGQILHQADALGAGIQATGMILFLLGMNWGGSAYPWRSVQTLVPLILGLVILTAFAVYQWKWRKDGLLDHRLYKQSRNFALATYALMVEGWVYFTPIAAYIPAEIRNAGWESDPVLIGCRALILTAAAFTTAIPLSIYVTKRKDVRTPLVVGFTMFFFSCVMFAQATPGPRGDKLVMGGMALAGVGFAAPLILLNVVVQLACPPELIATATAVVAAFRAIGGSVGSAILSSITTNKLVKKLPELVIPAALGAGMPESSIEGLLGALFVSPTLLPFVPGITPEITAAVIPQYEIAVTYQYSFAFYSLLPVIFTAIVACACLESVAPQMNHKVDHFYEKKVIVVAEATSPSVVADGKESA